MPIPKGFIPDSPLPIGFIPDSSPIGFEPDIDPAKLAGEQLEIAQRASSLARSGMEITAQMPQEKLTSPYEDIYMRSGQRTPGDVSGETGMAKAMFYGGPEIAKAALQAPTEMVSYGLNLPSKIANVARQAGYESAGQGPAPADLYEPDALPMGQPIGPAIPRWSKEQLAHGDFAQGAFNSFADLVDSLRTPENALMLPFAGYKPIQALFAGQMGAQAPDALGSLVEGITAPEMAPGERGAAIGSGAINLAMLGGLAHGMAKEPVPKSFIPDALAEAPSGAEIGQQLGLTHKEWPKEVPGLGGMMSFTDPKTGFTIEGVKPGTGVEEVRQRMAAKLAEEPPKGVIANAKEEKAQAPILGNLMSVEAAGLRHDLLPLLDKEKRTSIAQYYQSSGDLEGALKQAQDEWKKQISGVQELDRRGVVPEKLNTKTIGAGIQMALEKNKESGAVWNPFFNWNKPKTGVKFTGADALPDFMAKNLSNIEFAKKFASDKVPVLGRLMGGKARIEGPVDESLASWYAEVHGAGPAISSALGEQMRGVVNGAFKTDEKGDLNVVLNNPNASLKISDVFEGVQKGTGDYKFTPEQTQVWTDVIKPLLDRMQGLTKQYDLVDVAKEYFPRIVTERANEEKVGGGQKVGAKQFFQKERVFATEREGWDKGTKYSTDVEARLVKGVERMYRAMADKRLADDPVLGGKSRAALEADLKLSYAPELAAGTMTADDVRRIANSLQSQGTVWSPSFFGKIFDSETAGTLNKEFAAEASKVRRAIAQTNSLLKAIKLGFDFGAGQIQLLPMLYSNPLTWAQAQGKALHSMFDPQVFAEYTRQNIEPIREMAKYGSGVGRLQEHMAGVGDVLPRNLEKIPVVGKPLAEVTKAFGRQFQTSLDVAKVELWKAARDGKASKDFFETILGVERQVLSGRMENAMVPHSRALMERILFLAPSYYRAAIDQVAAIGSKGITGSMARKSMGSFVVGSLATYWAVGQMTGMSNEELVKRLNPGRTDFLMWTIKDGKKQINVGFGGVFRSFIRLFGSMAGTSSKNLASTDPDKNPLVRWYRGHAGPVVNIGWNLTKLRDFSGRQADVGSEIKGAVLPMALEKGGKVEKTASLLGLSAYEKRRGTADVAKELYGKDLERLTLGQRAKVQKNLKEETGPPDTDTQRRVMEQSTGKEIERRENLMSALPKAQQSWLSDQKLMLRSYSETMGYAREDLTLTAEERKFLGERIAKEYERVIGAKMESETFKTKAPLRRQESLDEALELARRRAWTAMRREMRKERTSSTGQ